MNAKAKLKVRNRGNSLAVRIPSAVAPAARLVHGQPVVVEAVDGGIGERPQSRPPRMTLSQKLRAFDPALHGGGLMADGAVGGEFS